MATAHNAPGKHYRKGISLVQAIKQFGDDAKAEAWFVARRWPNGIQCPKCGERRHFYPYRQAPDPAVPLQGLYGKLHGQKPTPSCTTRNCH